MRENREIPHPPPEHCPGGRVGKDGVRNPAVDGGGKSDRPIVPTKSPNKAGQPAAEAAEGRGLTKENADRQNTPRTQSRNDGVSSALDRVRQAALRNRSVLDRAPSGVSRTPPRSSTGSFSIFHRAPRSSYPPTSVSPPRPDPSGVVRARSARSYRSLRPPPR